MVLDEERKIIGLSDKVLKLTNLEFIFFTYIIKNKNKKIIYNKDIIMKIYDVDNEIYPLFKASFNSLFKRIKKKFAKYLTFNTINGFGFIFFYNIDSNTKNDLNKIEIKSKIFQLKEEIHTREKQIKELEKGLKK